jgi:hypothetical protein
MKKNFDFESDLALQNTISLMAKNDEVKKVSSMLREALRYVPRHYRKLERI